MTQEQKDKLFKYLCMALPYGLKVHWEGCDYGDKTKNLVTIDEFRTINDEFQVEDCKPYLRPMSSMTEEDWGEYRQLIADIGIVADAHHNPIIGVSTYLNWVLEKHYDFMGLIPMGAAIKITDDNNPYKE